jgi:hypothetical protein
MFHSTANIHDLQSSYNLQNFDRQFRQSLPNLTSPAVEPRVDLDVQESSIKFLTKLDLSDSLMNSKIPDKDSKICDLMNELLLSSDELVSVLIENEKLKSIKTTSENTVSINFSE